MQQKSPCCIPPTCMFLLGTNVKAVSISCKPCVRTACDLLGWILFACRVPASPAVPACVLDCCRVTGAGTDLSEVLGLNWIHPGLKILSRSLSRAIPEFNNFIFKKLSISFDRAGVFKDGKVKEINRLLIGQACNSLVNWI